MSKQGFPGLPCLLCGEADTTMLKLNDGHFHCEQCGQDFDQHQATEIVHQWAEVLSWVKDMPFSPKEDNNLPERLRELAN